MRVSWDERVAPSRPLKERLGDWMPERVSPLLAAQIATLLLMTGSLATRTWVDYPWFSYALIGITVALWVPEVRRKSARTWWFVYVAGIFVYTLLRSYADETEVPVRTEYVIRVDKWFFGGTDPVAWLQAQWFDRAHVGWLDLAAVGVHWSFFIVPHAAAIAIFIWRRDLFPRFTVMIVGLMYVALVVFFLVPTAPPWLAGQSGSLPGVFRVMDFVGGSVNGDTYQDVYASLGEPNSVAAMPSLHMGITFALFLWAADEKSRWAPLLLIYSGLMALSLMYLGEHYLLDILVGAGFAFIVFRLSKRFVPAIESWSTKTSRPRAPSPAAPGAAR